MRRENLEGKAIKEINKRVSEFKMIGRRVEWKGKWPEGDRML